MSFSGDATRNKPKILITHSDIPHSAFDIFEDKYELIFSKGEGHSNPTRETILSDIKGVDAVFWFGHVKVDKEMIDAAGSKLKVIGCMGAGYDHIDVKLLQERGIAFSNTPNLLSNAVADLAVGLALAVSRNILRGHHAVVNNQWNGVHPTWMCGPALDGATVGVVGLGDIGCQIAQRIKGFNIAHLLYTGHRQRSEARELGAKFASLDQLLAESDFIFLSLPLTPETRHLLDMSKFKKMKPTSILINVSRGGLVNQEDLVEALKSNIIGGAGLDVMTPEPLPQNHVLTTLPNVVLTPHIASATFLARETVAKLATLNIYNVLNNEPMLTPVTSL